MMNDLKYLVLILSAKIKIIIIAQAIITLVVRYLVPTTVYIV